MSVEDAQAALERIVNNVLPHKHTGIMAAADALGDACELRGHLGACRVWRIPNQSWETVGQAKCGDGWYCPDAPVKEPPA